MRPAQRLIFPSLERLPPKSAFVYRLILYGFDEDPFPTVVLLFVFLAVLISFPTVVSTLVKK